MPEADPSLILDGTRKQISEVLDIIPVSSTFYPQCCRTLSLQSGTCLELEQLHFGSRETHTFHMPEMMILLRVTEPITESFSKLRISLSKDSLSFLTPPYPSRSNTGTVTQTPPDLARCPQSHGRSLNCHGEEHNARAATAKTRVLFPQTDAGVLSQQQRDGDITI